MTNDDKELARFQRHLELTKRIEKIRHGFGESAKIPAIHLKRSFYLRQKLKEHKAVETYDNDGIVGIVLEPELFEELLEYLDNVEERLEEESFQAMEAQRKGTEGFSTGKKLKEDTLSHFNANQEGIRKFLDDES